MIRSANVLKRNACSTYSSASRIGEGDLFTLLPNEGGRDLPSVYIVQVAISSGQSSGFHFDLVPVKNERSRAGIRPQAQNLRSDFAIVCCLGELRLWKKILVANGEVNDCCFV